MPCANVQSGSGSNGGINLAQPPRKEYYSANYRSQLEYVGAEKGHQT